MVFIKTISKEDAQSPLKELYKEMEETFGVKKVPNAFISSSIDYEITKWFWESYKTITMRDSSIPRTLKEGIIIVVSKNNSCHYCVDVHNTLLKAMGYDPKKIEALNQDYKGSDFSEKEKDVFDFALKVSNESYKITEKDLDYLRTKHGMTDQQILEVITVSSFYDFVNRFENALGTDLEKLKEVTV